LPHCFSPLSTEFLFHLEFLHTAFSHSFLSHLFLSAHTTCTSRFYSLEFLCFWAFSGSIDSALSLSFLQFLGFLPAGSCGSFSLLCTPSLFSSLYSGMPHSLTALPLSFCLLSRSFSLDSSLFSLDLWVSCSTTALSFSHGPLHTAFLDFSRFSGSHSFSWSLSLFTTFLWISISFCTHSLTLFSLSLGPLSRSFSLWNFSFSGLSHVLFLCWVPTSLFSATAFLPLTPRLISALVLDSAFLYKISVSRCIIGVLGTYGIPYTPLSFLFWNALHFTIWRVLSLYRFHVFYTRWSLLCLEFSTTLTALPVTILSFSWVSGLCLNFGTCWVRSVPAPASCILESHCTAGFCCLPAPLWRSTRHRYSHLEAATCTAFSCWDFPACLPGSLLPARFQLTTTGVWRISLWVDAGVCLPPPLEHHWSLFSFLWESHFCHTLECLGSADFLGTWVEPLEIWVIDASACDLPALEMPGCLAIVEFHCCCSVLLHIRTAALTGFPGSWALVLVFSACCCFCVFSLSACSPLWNFTHSTVLFSLFHTFLCHSLDLLSLCTGSLHWVHFTALHHHMPPALTVSLCSFFVSLLLWNFSLLCLDSHCTSACLCIPVHFFLQFSWMEVLYLPPAAACWICVFLYLTFHCILCCVLIFLRFAILPVLRYTRFVLGRFWIFYRFRSHLHLSAGGLSLRFCLLLSSRGFSL